MIFGRKSTIERFENYMNNNHIVHKYFPQFRKYGPSRKLTEWTGEFILDRKETRELLKTFKEFGEVSPFSDTFVENVKNNPLYSLVIETQGKVPKEIVAREVEKKQIYAHVLTGEEDFDILYACRMVDWLNVPRGMDSLKIYEERLEELVQEGVLKVETREDRGWEPIRNTGGRDIGNRLYSSNLKKGKEVAWLSKPIVA
jgi:hypothetical protein